MASIQSYFFRTLAYLLSNFYVSRLSLEDMRRDTRPGVKPRIPAGSTLQPVSIGSVPAEWIDTPGVDSQKVILYLHGGGWVLGWGNTHRGLVSYLGRAAKARVLAIDYRLAPEHPFPAGLEDCLAAYRWVLQQGYSPQHVVIAGDSAGGNLTLTTLISLRDTGDPLPAAGACLSPATDLAGHEGSYITNATRDAVLPRKFAEKLAAPYLEGVNPLDPRVSPIYANLQGLPPLLIQVGSDEILLDDARRFSDKACQAGVDVNLHVYPGMWHVWQIFAPYLPEGRAAIEEAGEYIRQRIA